MSMGKLLKGRSQAHEDKQEVHEPYDGVLLNVVPDRGGDGRNMSLLIPWALEYSHGLLKQYLSLA